MDGREAAAKKHVQHVEELANSVADGDLDALDQALSSLFSRLAQPLGLPCSSQSSPTGTSLGNMSSSGALPGSVSSTSAHLVVAEAAGRTSASTSAVISLFSDVPTSSASLESVDPLNSSGRASNTPS